MIKQKNVTTLMVGNVVKNKFIYETRIYKHTLEDGVTNEYIKVKYTILLTSNGVENVWNEYGESINKNSEAYEYFCNKYN